MDTWARKIGKLGSEAIFARKASDSKCSNPSSAVTIQKSPTNALELITGAEDLVGLYSVGGGNSGTIRALEERLISTKPAFVCHELVPPQRGGLIRGTIDVVLAADLPQLARSTLDLFVELKDLSYHKKRIVAIPFHIYTSENVLGSNSVGE
jgi:ABC-type sugar transport system substrate-binding protein